MEEEIKKDLKEIKEEIETQEKSIKESEKKKSKAETEIKKSLEEEKTKESEKLDITPEKAEGLVEKLIKSEEEEEVSEEKIPKKFRTRDLFFIFGSIFTIIFIIIGIWISLKLIKGDFSKKENINSLSEPEVLIPESTAFKKFSKIVILKDEKETDYPYKLKIKNFLIPIDSKEFLKLNITLYFDQNTSTEELEEKEFDFRETLYSYFKNIPIDVWKDTKNISILKEKIKEKLKEKKIKPLPQEIKLEGVILKG